MFQNAIGLDEVGRGSWAGPVVAGAVCFKKPFVINDRRLPVRIDDSKKLTALQRQEASLWIYENAHAWGVGVGKVSKINNAGIVPATNFAFRLAIKELLGKCPKKPEKLLIDAFYIPKVASFPRHTQTAIIHGDSLVFEIAAASIIAKVYRDALMEKLSKKFPLYLWEQNKGYGTARHRQAILQHGITNHHRSLYVRGLTRSSSSQV